MTTNIIPYYNSNPELVRICDNESIDNIDTSKTVCAVTEKQEAEPNRQLDFFELLQI